jgi:hypothetical protein
MKKRIMSLMMGVSLFASTQVIAMDQENEEDKYNNKSIILFKTGEKEYKREGNKNVLNIVFDKYDNTEFGNFNKINKNPIKIILSYLIHNDLKGFLNMSEASKPFYMLCASMEDFHKKYEEVSLFSKDIPYTITIEQLRGFANQSKDNVILDIDKPWESSTNICDDTQICEFSRGKNWFKLYNRHQNAHDYVYKLPKESAIEFSWKEDVNNLCRIPSKSDGSLSFS